MAEKVIGLRLELNGFKGVVTSIKELEEELRKAKEDLTELEIGSDNFKTLAREISGAESKLLDLRKASEGIGLEKKLEGYGKLAAGITSSFAAAQSAVALFGSDSTLVAEAATQAQNLLTLALSARGFEEVAVGAKIVARTIAEKAATAATLTSNNALKVLYTTIAANPIGALVTAVGLLVTAFIALNQEEEDLTETTVKLGKVTSDEATKLTTYVNVLNSANSSNNSRLAIVRELNKTYPGFNVFLDTENRLNREGKIFIDAKTKSLILQAKAQELVKKITENSNKIAEVQSQSVEESLTTWDKLEGTFVRLFSAYGTYGEAVNNAVNAIENQNEATGKYEKANLKLEEQLQSITDQQGALDAEIIKGQEAMRKRAEADAKAAANKTKVVKETKIEIQVNQELIKTLTEEEKIKAQLLVTDLELGDANAEIVKNLTDQEAAAKTFAEKLNDLKNVTQLFAEVQKKLIPQSDEIGDSFNDIRDAGEMLFDTLKSNKQSIEDFNKEWEKYGKLSPEQELEKQAELLKLTTDNSIKYNEALENLNKVSKDVRETNKDLFTPEQLSQLTKYENSYRQFTDAVKVFSSIPIEPPFDAAQFEQDLIDVQLLLGKITVDPFQRPLEQANKEILDAQERLQKDGERFVTAYIAKRKQESTEFQKFQQDLTSKDEKTKQTAVKTIAELENIYKEAGKEAFKNLVDAGNEVIVFENGVAKVKAQVEDLTKKLKELAPAAQEGFVLTNKQAITDQFIVDIPQVEDNQAKLLQLSKELSMKTYDTQKTYQEDVNTLEKQLLAQGLDISKFSYATKLELLKEFLAKEIAATDLAEKTKQEKLTETVNKINQALQIASKGITDIAGLVAQSFQIQLDRLSVDYKDAMDGIVGDTEEANQKRIETEQSYQAEKAQIERKAQINALKFTLASTVATGAQAIVTALTLPPPANFIVGALNAGITAAQVALIQTQINDIQSQPLRRGGYLSMGGFIEGPSHEQGGVYAGGGYTLEGNESVINRQSTLQYSGLLSSINQSGGGRPIVVQSPMDSRLVEALAKQKTEPIRAYVVEQDITAAQGINRRLEQLASF